MNNQTPTRNRESAKHSLRIKVLLEKLRSKLKNFSVLGNGEIVLGQLKDVYLDPARQLNLAIADATTLDRPRLFLLRSTHIQKVDYTSKSLYVDIDKTEVNALPEYKSPKLAEVPVEELPSISATRQASQTEMMLSPTESPDELEEPESDLPDVLEEEVIRLLEERLVVDVTKQKVGEVIVRKEIVTEIIEVPVRREKLIVEQVSPERRQLAEIDLGHADTSDVNLLDVTSRKSRSTVSGTFASPKTASLVLDAIAKQRNHNCKQVRVEMVVDDAEHQQTYQEWFDRCSGT